MLWSATFKPAFLQDIGAGLRTCTSCTAIVQMQNNSRFRKLDKLDRSRKMASLRDCTPVTALMTRQDPVLAPNGQLDYRDTNC
jgi:hypothetical protein